MRYLEFLVRDFLVGSGISQATFSRSATTHARAVVGQLINFGNMSAGKATWIILGVCLMTASSCSERILEGVEAVKLNTLSSKFEKQKGKMKPVDGRIDSYTGCRLQSESIYNTACCFFENRQTFFSDSRIVGKAVADGEIVKVRTAEQTKLYGIVIIRHGAYLSVYGNLDKIFVNEGDKISLGFTIGEAGVNFRGTHNELLFDIYSKSQTIDPKEWVALN